MNARFSDRGLSNKRFVVVLIAITVFSMATIAVAFRIEKAPDIFTDEIIYTRIGIRVGGERALVWDSGQPFVVHPPLYYLVAGTYLSVTHASSLPVYSAGDIFDFVFQMRYLNAIFAGMTSVVLFWFGKRLHSLKLGILLAGLFFLDPFGVRINRRAMLETLAMLLSLSGMAFFWVSAQSRRSEGRFLWLSPRVIIAGLLLGFSLLVKELMFINLLPLVFYAIWDDGLLRYSNRAIHPHRGIFFRLEGHRTLMKAIQTVLIVVLTYGLYLMWVLLDANTAPFFAEKLLGIQRLFGLVQLTGWNRPGISFASILIERLRDYGTSYLLISLGGVSVLWLLFYSFVARGARFLTAWGMVLYPLFTFIAFAGSGNDQFFYFLLIPALILVGYAVITFPEAAHHLFSKGIPESLPGVRFMQSVSSNSWRSIDITILVLLMVLFIPYNSTAWISNYVWGSDNGYSQFSQFVQANLPPGERLNASGDPIKFRYFLPDQTITAASTPEEAIQGGVNFFALAPKDVLMRYGCIQPELADWIQANGIQLFDTQGSSYGEIRLYQVELPDGSAPPNISQVQNNLKGNYFQPAKSSFIDSLTILLISWSFIWLGLAFFIYQSSKWDTKQRVRNNGQQTDWV